MKRPAYRSQCPSAARIGPIRRFRRVETKPPPPVEKAAQHGAAGSCGKSVANNGARSWMECSRLLATALVVGLGPMLDNGRLINTYSDRYGALAWPSLYQCDVRCRREHMERLRRVLGRKFMDATTRGQAPAVPFDPARPWDSVKTAACEDFGFWHVQFEEPAPIILTRSGRFSDGKRRLSMARKVHHISRFVMMQSGERPGRQATRVFTVKAMGVHPQWKRRGVMFKIPVGGLPERI